MKISLKNKLLDPNNPIVIALDGPSASGKGLIGRTISKQFDVDYFQSSILYRWLALRCINNKIDLQDFSKIISIALEYEKPEYSEYDLSDEKVGDVASIVSSIAEVRKIFDSYQKNLIKESHRIILEGRDISTIIAPFADLKIFITADPEIRAERRYKQLLELGKNCIMRDVFDQILLRDHRDKTRAIAPLTLAEDALVVDTSHLNPEQIIDQIIDFVSSR